MRFHYYSPLDPDCPEAEKIYADAQIGYDDPMTIAMGAGEFIRDMTEERENKHRVRCKRCQAYGAANIDVKD